MWAQAQESRLENAIAGVSRVLPMLEPRDQEVLRSLEAYRAALDSVRGTQRSEKERANTITQSSQRVFGQLGEEPWAYLYAPVRLIPAPGE